MTDLPKNIAHGLRPNNFIGTEQSSGVEWFLTRIGGRIRMRRMNEPLPIYRPTLQAASDYLRNA